MVPLANRRIPTRDAYLPSPWAFMRRLPPGVRTGLTNLCFTVESVVSPTVACLLASFSIKVSCVTTILSLAIFIHTSTLYSPSVVLEALLGTAGGLLGLLLLVELRSLRLDLTGTSEGSVDLSHFGLCIKVCVWSEWVAEAGEKVSVVAVLCA